MKGTVLIVDDDASIAKLVRTVLRQGGYSAEHVESAEKALGRLAEAGFDLLLLDINMGGMSGLKLLEILKQDPRTSGLPVILMTVKKEENTKVSALLGGADDYLVKPFSYKELLARVEALLRRVQRGGALPNALEAAGVTVDFDRRQVSAGGKPVELTRGEFELLSALMRAQGKVVSYRELEDALARGAKVVTSATLYVHVNNLRKKLGAKADRIATVHGVGYRFNP